MAIFDSIVDLAKQRAGLSDSNAGGLVAALLRLISDPASGGFGGFIERFRNAGLGSVVDSWISRGDNTPISNEQVESALGSDTIAQVAGEAGVDRGAATSAIASVLPGVVDTLTPDGEIPDESSLLSRIGGFLSDWGGTIGGAVAGGVGAASAIASGAAGTVGDAAGATYDKGKEILGSGVGAVGGAAGAARDKIGGAVGSVGNALDLDSDGGGLLKWLLPLLLLGLAIVLGFMFCGKGNAPVGNTGLNANANKPANVAVNATANANANANTAEHVLGEVALPDGTKLQAYPGGIEDQLVKYLSSGAYKTATEEQIKSSPNHGWYTFDDLNFESGSSTKLTAESKRQFDNVVKILKAFPDVKVKIGGYTDRAGDDNMNLKLSDDRAKFIQKQLGAQAVAAEGYGEKEATVDEATVKADPKAGAVDRKTAIRVVGTDFKADATAPETKPAAANSAAPAANANAAHK